MGALGSKSVFGQVLSLFVISDCEEIIVPLDEADVHSYLFIYLFIFVPDQHWFVQIDGLYVILKQW